MDKRKPFTKGELNLMLEYGFAEKDTQGNIVPISDPYYPDKQLSAVNPFSGQTVMLNIFTDNLYRKILELYRECQRGGVPVSKYDRMKYLLLKIDSQAYMDLID